MVTFDYVDLNTWTIIRISGAQRIEYLNGIITQDIEHQVNGTFSRSAFLTPKAKIRSVFWILKEAELITLYCPMEMRDLLIEDLLKFKHNVDVKLEDISSEVGPLYLVTSETDHLSGFDSEDQKFTFYQSFEKPVGDGIPYAEFKDWMIANKLVPVDLLFNENPFEVGIYDAVVLDKGCFLGQEPLSRMYYRGKPRKNLYYIHCSSNPSDLTLFQNNQKVGEVVTLVEHNNKVHGIAFLNSKIDEHSVTFVGDVQIKELDRIGTYPQINR
ncbi:MAG: CAF17-like 4Fe-4S cluster assembly/insertion protein YgfZ [Candidatus Kariarchaeaceae archaeon]